MTNVSVINERSLYCLDEKCYCKVKGRAGKTMKRLTIFRSMPVFVVREAPGYSSGNGAPGSRLNWYVSLLAASRIFV